MPFLVNIKKRRNGAQPYFHAIRFIDCVEIVKGFGMLLGKENGVFACVYIHRHCLRVAAKPFILTIDCVRQICYLYDI